MRILGKQSPMAWLVAVLTVGLLTMGCETTQSVVDIRQHPTEDVTVIHTMQQGLMESGHRFWHCVREDDELVCDVVCGDDIQCPQRPGMIRADRSAAAQLGGPTQKSADRHPEPAPKPDAERSQEEPDADGAQDDGEASETDDDQRRRRRR